MLLKTPRRQLSEQAVSIRASSLLSAHSRIEDITPAREESYSRRERSVLRRKESVERHEEAPRGENVPMTDEVPRREDVPGREEAPRREEVPRREEAPRREEEPRREEAPRREQSFQNRFSLLKSLLLNVVATLHRQRYAVDDQGEYLENVLKRLWQRTKILAYVIPATFERMGA